MDIRVIKDAWKKTRRWIFSLSAVQWTIAVVIVALIWCAFLTCRAKYRGANNLKKLKGKPCIAAFWHGRSMMLSPVAMHLGLRGYGVFSRSRDGRMMAKLQRLFGIRGIYGSTGKHGAVSVLIEGVKILRQGNMIILSPDGPRGPRMRVHDGVLFFAKMSGAPIVPICFSAKHAWFLNNWDRYLIVRPFNKMVFEAGEPFYIGKKDDIEAARAKLEQIMTKQLQDLDAEFGHPKIEPGEVKQK
ncbi:MAG: lysophospholipid acyltransferase family protein [Alphaproteobacteria bacterium]|nr:lysophospholipid acyltransferase family protein [Alphaproteobacteria bacterium]MCL2757717.1 lysophospholipid acyltransferase family protein [Alphaproteobacteria bacterium]